MKKTILFVCNGNIHRSVIAESCLNKVLRENGLDREYVCLSRGLQGTGGTKVPKHLNLRDYPLEWSLTEPVLNRLGIAIPTEQQSTPIEELIVGRVSLILAMDTGVFMTRPNSLSKQFPHSGFKTRLFLELDGKITDVPDCFGRRNAKTYRKVICLIHSVIRTRTRQILQLADIHANQLQQI